MSVPSRAAGDQRLNATVVSSRTWNAKSDISNEKQQMAQLLDSDHQGRLTAFGFRSFRNYRIRALLYAGKPNWDLLATITPRQIPMLRNTRRAVLKSVRSANQPSCERTADKCPLSPSSPGCGHSSWSSRTRRAACSPSRGWAESMGWFHENVVWLTRTVTSTPLATVLRSRRRSLCRTVTASNPGPSRVAIPSGRSRDRHRD